MLYLWLKTFHLIGVVSWFAALFYIVRLFVYHAEAQEEAEPRRMILMTQYAVMERRLYNMIQNPAMWITTVTAAGLLVLQPSYLREPWMVAKLVLVALLIAFHYASARMMRAFLAGHVRRSGEWFRWANEAPTLLLVAVTILAVFKSAIPWSGLGWAMAGLVVFIVGGIRYYAKFRRRHPERVPLAPPAPRS
jgi:putative membrane protein